MVAKRDSFLLRIDPRVLEAVRHWSDDDLRSVNGQIEFLLRTALVRAGRWSSESTKPNASSASGTSPSDSQA